MSRSKRFKDAQEKRDGGAFITVPLVVLNSRAYLDASPHARMLLFDLLAQYRGNNNGDLCAAWKLMKPRRWRSETTLNKAKHELLELGLIVETRKGARPNKASLYAVTWHALDHCDGKLDISPQAFQRGAYRLRDACESGQKNAVLTPSGGVESMSIAPPGGVDTVPPTPPDGAIRTQNGHRPTPPGGVLSRSTICPTRS